VVSGIVVRRDGLVPGYYWRAVVKTIVLLIALLALIPASVAADERSTSSTSVSIKPGPFLTTLAVDNGMAVLTVVDATGSGRGWWVTVECTCGWDLVGAVRDAHGGTEHTPQWEGTTLVADPDEGMGTFRQTFVATAGRWIVSASQGERP
jgi:hypothetical protein